ncbi:phage holin [Bifidobacterium panos]|uniref:Holin n=1 Tax=Bifidobacterium panos TaxID=2675321 RepID=A0ABX1SXW3_9BIFI|nr:phage holin [Bifidobacterium sp. DSM 109963]NMN02670.1 holin [Bifidobacterium sp. DSM 109963]
MSDPKHAEGVTPETDEQTDARLATLATVETTSATDTAATDDTSDGQMPTWLLPDKAYQVLKWLTLTVLPALAVLVGALGPVWGLPYTDAIVTTISAVALFFGATIGVSAIRANGLTAS